MGIKLKILIIPKVVDLFDCLIMVSTLIYIYVKSCRQFGTVVSAFGHEAGILAAARIQFPVSIVNPLYSKVVLGQQN